MTADKKIAVISDIHGNLEALDSVLAHIAEQSIDTVYCLGDIVGYGPNPRECIDRVKTLSMSLLGNHDNGALFDPDGFSSAAEKAIFWTRRQIEDVTVPGGQERWDFLSRLPRTHREGSLMFVHGSPRNPLNEYVFPEDIYNQRKIERIFSFIQNFCFQGHTHVPGVFTESCRFYSPSEIGHCYVLADQKLMINVGSVGQPRDGDNRSCYVTLEGNQVCFHRVAYDAKKTSDKIFNIPELDNFLGQRLLEGK
jgi:predicted phosphodiesterase